MTEWDIDQIAPFPTTWKAVEADDEAEAIEAAREMLLEWARTEAQFDAVIPL
jgi:hypothetical protein